MPRQHRFKHPSALQEQREQRAALLRRAADDVHPGGDDGDAIDPMRDPDTMSKLRGLLKSPALQPPKK